MWSVPLSNSTYPRQRQRYIHTRHRMRRLHVFICTYTCTFSAHTHDQSANNYKALNCTVDSCTHQGSRQNPWTTSSVLSTNAHAPRGDWERSLTTGTLKKRPSLLLFTQNYAKTIASCQKARAQSCLGRCMDSAWTPSILL